jgi:hypothetical protein
MLPIFWQHLDRHKAVHRHKYPYKYANKTSHCASRGCMYAWISFYIHTYTHLHTYSHTITYAHTHYAYLQVLAVAGNEVQNAIHSSRLMLGRQGENVVIRLTSDGQTTYSVQLMHGGKDFIAMAECVQEATMLASKIREGGDTNAQAVKVGDASDMYLYTATTCALPSHLDDMCCALTLPYHFPFILTIHVLVYTYYTCPYVHLLQLPCLYILYHAPIHTYYIRPYVYPL